jgi:hypothetical protein
MTEHGGDGVYGAPNQMGLPPVHQYAALQRHYVCQGISPLDCRPPGGYGAVWPMSVTKEESVDEEKWIEYVQRYGASAVFVYDMFHPLSCPATMLSANRAYGLQIGGSVKSRTKRAFPGFPLTFFDPP